METIYIHQVSCCGNLPLLGVSKYKETHSFPRIGNVRNLTGNVCLHLVSSGGNRLFFIVLVFEFFTMSLVAI